MRVVLREMLLISATALPMATSSTLAQVQPAPKPQVSKQMSPKAVGEVSNWRSVTSVDELSGKKELKLTTKAMSTFQQFGHAVSTELWLFCSEGTLDAMLVFSERIGVSDILIRARFDDGPVYSKSIPLRNQYGRSLSFIYGDEEGGRGTSEHLIPKLISSSRVRVQLGLLPWANSALLEFRTRGLSEAANTLGCSQ